MHFSLFVYIELRQITDYTQCSFPFNFCLYNTQRQKPVTGAKKKKKTIYIYGTVKISDEPVFKEYLT